jgi:thioredoxin 1
VSAGETRAGTSEGLRELTDADTRKRALKEGNEIERPGIFMENTTGPVQVTDATFESEVIHSPLPVVVDFYADWCVPCRVTEPVLADLATRLAGRVKFAKVNIDDAAGITRSYGIHSIPTYVFVESGQEKGREVGPVGPIAFRTILRRYFSETVRASGGTPASR